MTALVNPLSPSMLRDAAESVVSDVLMWAKYGTEISENVDLAIAEILESLAEYLEVEPITELDDVETIVSDFCDDVARSLEDMRGNGLATDITDGDVIYTSDIITYYTENTNEVEEALAECYGGLGDFDTISDAISAGVALALENIAESEISGVIDAFETWAKEEMTKYIFA
ncbi:hypothetical protein SEA_STICKYNOTE_88 [Corynebacterium phage Stickynote]|uniref:Uncharacterized protein n=1 Tax=Corynebacterium phage Stickynote TaxID=2588503 RepID=A0A4Y6EP71_9CAUD|nr:hypothetical protein KNU65_gp54 [Corynebacterium phage Stickynote]QDF19281.1 hypothetical protein SEA_STICKYNOTE_88 [Corynebacterium phage Stickynote]